MTKERDAHYTRDVNRLVVVPKTFAADEAAVEVGLIRAIKPASFAIALRGNATLDESGVLTHERGTLDTSAIREAAESVGATFEIWPNAVRDA